MGAGTGLADGRKVVSLAERRAATRAAARPVVLLHGFASSPRVLVPLERHLRRTLGREIWPLSVPGAAHGDLRETARRIDASIEARLACAAADAVDVVSHSMGGLVATWLLKRVDRGRRVRSVVTLGTPHRGLPLARLAAAVAGGLCPALAQMAPGAPFLEELKWLPVPDGSTLVSVCGARDALVSERAARLTPLPGHRNVRVADARHASLLLSPGVFAIVGALLGGAPAPLPPAPALAPPALPAAA